MKNILSIYNETYLQSEFTIGFELEGFASTYEEYQDFKKVIEKTFDNNYDSKTIHGTHAMGKDSSIAKQVDICDSCDGNGFEEEECENCGGEGCEECNGLGFFRNECDSCNGIGFFRYDDYDSYDEDEDEETDHAKLFEWKSPIFNVTPENLSKIINFLNESLDYVSTNISCGFHIHIGLPTFIQKSVDRDMFWILLNLCNENKIKSLIHFKKFMLVQHEYASEIPFLVITNLLKEINDDNKNEVMINIINKLYLNTKFINFRQHPQGTLEWRGPRGFLDTKNRRIIKDFFIHLWNIIKLMSQYLDKQEITTVNNITFSRKEIYELILNKGSYTLTDRKKYNVGNFMDMFSESMFPENISKILKLYPWIKNCEFNDGIFELFNENKLIFGNGTWNKGNFYGLRFNGSVAPLENLEIKTEELIDCDIKRMESPVVVKLKSNMINLVLNCENDYIYLDIDCKLLVNKFNNYNNYYYLINNINANEIENLSFIGSDNFPITSNIKSQKIKDCKLSKLKLSVVECENSTLNECVIINFNKFSETTFEECIFEEDIKSIINSNRFNQCFFKNCLISPINMLIDGRSDNIKYKLNKGVK